MFTLRHWLEAAVEHNEVAVAEFGKSPPPYGALRSRLHLGDKFYSRRRGAATALFFAFFFAFFFSPMDQVHVIRHQVLVEGRSQRRVAQSSPHRAVWTLIRATNGEQTP